MGVLSEQMVSSPVAAGLAGSWGAASFVQGGGHPAFWRRRALRDVAAWRLTQKQRSLSDLKAEQQHDPHSRSHKLFAG